MHKRTIFLVICLVALVLIIPGCSGTQRDETTNHVNTVYYNSLKEGNYTNLLRAHPQFPASGELFSENTSIFKLEPANANSLSKKLPDAMLSDFALYFSPASAPKRVASTVSDLPAPAPSPSSAIPSLKRQDVIPDSCLGLTGTAFRDCLENLGGSAVPQSDHVSMHDPQSLAIEAGQTITDSIPGKTIQTLTSNVSKADRDAIVAKLTDFTNDDPTHASINLAAFDPFNPTGYSLASVIISDSSMSDTNGDGVLEPHSTMTTEILKPVGYRRSPSVALDTCLSKYGDNIADRYVVKVTTLVHLDSLKAQRQSVPVFTTDSGVDFYQPIHDAMTTNHALDANIIKSIYDSTAILPGSSTEYTFMFQIDPDQISGEYKNLLEKIAVEGDTACQDVVEQHINPRTAIISGVSATGNSPQKTAGSLTVFYQVPAAFSRQLTAKIASALTGQDATLSDNFQPIRDYCMVNGDGLKVAIVDPVSGAIIPACEKYNQKALAKTVLMTKSGACKDDRGNWAYDASRLRTKRFGRGIQWIFTEWLLHNQVGDYKNIHWYQSTWKSGVQVAVKGAKYLLATYLKIQIGAIKIEGKDKDKIDQKKKIKYLKSLLPLIKDVVLKINGTKIAGYKLSLPPVVGDFLGGSSKFFPSGAGSDDTFGNPSLDYWLLLELKQGVKGFFVDRVTDAAAQMLDVTITGWQDISDRSHYGCFEFD
ncbi:hypothetical protein [Pelotalea chapellei]|uniref:Uncharacterized protein n=1 Tax=Pelotalea chapellei TaxID=44671 RepID=A0ABS5U3H6_9BACT|nr:hypothetical protein [Pelotalea chapellei]MBT1070195.1 hypothetical protein [Pelotalea chapellei]